MKITWDTATEDLVTVLHNAAVSSDITDGERERLLSLADIIEQAQKRLLNQIDKSNLRLIAAAPDWPQQTENQ